MIYQGWVDIRYVQESGVNIVDFFVPRSSLLEVCIGKVQQHIFVQNCGYGTLVDVGSLVTKQFCCINIL
jgi:hypothetical protein